MGENSGSAEALLSAGFRRVGENFLSFHATLLKGEATEEHLHFASVEIARAVGDLGQLLREHASQLRIGMPTDGYSRSGNHSLHQEFELLAKAVELTGRKLSEIPANVPSLGESDTLRPLASLRERLVEGGRKFIVVSSLLGESDLILSELPLDHGHLNRLEKRLAYQVKELDDLLLITREQVSVAVVELGLTLKKRP